MHLKNIIQAKFIEKENRFVGVGEIKGEKVKFHIGDTGRLKELLYNGNEILLQKLEEKQDRKYNFRLICAKGLLGYFILVNSLLHSALITEYFKKKNIDFKKEVKYGNSRIDFLFGNTFIEVKGVSLVEKQNKDFVAMFPDAPTIRGQKHLLELININKTGEYKAKILFLVTNNVGKFKPNEKIDKKFSDLFYKFLENGGEVVFLFAKCEFLGDKVSIKVLEKNNVVIL